MDLARVNAIEKCFLCSLKIFIGSSPVLPETKQNVRMFRPTETKGQTAGHKNERGFRRLKWVTAARLAELPTKNQKEKCAGIIL